MAGSVTAAAKRRLQVLSAQCDPERRPAQLTAERAAAESAAVSATPTCQIREVDIPMADGVRLAADLYMPRQHSGSGSDTPALPVLLEYIPYRKAESRGSRYSVYAYFVERGFVVARVDIRGTGNSDGVVVPHEYSDIELDDGVVLIAWLAAQEFSNGNVGMFGISWGGFNSIQLAATRQPPALKTFISCMATEHLYAEDVHYIDGIMHTDSWMMSADLHNSMPGAPHHLLDEDWQTNRFDAKPSVYQYMDQQRNGPWWDRASSLDKYDRIVIPSFHIGGWYDGYRNSLPRMLQHVKNAPVKAMIGPWDHTLPHNAAPGPAMEWRHEAVRWFDYWLKGIDTGIMDEPSLAVYVREWHEPDPTIIDRSVPGSWRWEADGWPLQRTTYQMLYATPEHGLVTDSTSATEEQHWLEYKASVGLEGGGPVMWWGTPGPDQQKMDDDALVYDSEALPSPLEILGFPATKLRVSTNAVRANWVVRLCDVAPDGSVTQVVGGACNGTHHHRGSARAPQDLLPGVLFDLDVQMHWTSWVFPAGHRVRLAVTNAMWPMLWPTPYPMTTSLQVGGSPGGDGARLILPVIPPAAAAASSPAFLDPEPTRGSGLPGSWGELEGGNTSGYGEIDAIERDELSDESYGVATNYTAQQYPWGTERFDEAIEHRTSDADPARTSVTGRYALTTELVDGRTIRLEQEAVFRSDERNFRLTFDRRITVNDELVRQKRWDDTFRRDFQ